MGKCLVTRLDCIVNNSNIEYLEVENDFFNEAVAASGNTSMSDEQKSVLNHLFYTIGAVANNSTWSKIKFLYMPLIANDVAHAAIDYKDNTSAISGIIEGRLLYQNCGIVYNGTANTLAIKKVMLSAVNSDSLSFIQVYGGTSGDRSNLPTLVKNGSPLISTLYQKSNKQQGFSFGGLGLFGIYTAGIENLFAINIEGRTSNEVKIFTNNEDVLIAKTASIIEDRIVPFNTDGVEVNIRADSNRNDSLQFMMVADSFTNEEFENIVKAVIKVRNAFYS